MTRVTTRASCHCPECGLCMRTTYVQGLVEKNGKKSNRLVKMGYYCAFCNVFLNNRELEASM